MSAVSNQRPYQGSNLPEPVNGKVKLTGENAELFHGALKSMENINTRVTGAAMAQLPLDVIEIEVGKNEFHHVNAAEYRRIQQAALSFNPALERFRPKSIDTSDNGLKKAEETASPNDLIRQYVGEDAGLKNAEEMEPTPNDLIRQYAGDSSESEDEYDAGFGNNVFSPTSRKGVYHDSDDDLPAAPPPSQRRQKDEESDDDMKLPPNTPS